MPMVLLQTMSDYRPTDYQPLGKRPLKSGGRRHLLIRQDFPSLVPIISQKGVFRGFKMILEGDISWFQNEDEVKTKLIVKSSLKNHSLKISPGSKCKNNVFTSAV